MSTAVMALNIETGANLDMVDSLPPPDVKYGNTKDPLKRATKEAEAAASQRTKMALDPHFGVVLCVGLASYSSEQRVESAVRFTSDPGEDGIAVGERGLLQRAWKLIGKIDRLVTFNGSGFDIPFMLRRSAILGVKPDVHIETNKYRVQKLSAPGHTDLMHVLHETETGPGLGVPRTLSFYVKQFLGEEWPSADVDQSQLAELLTQEGGRQQIEELCSWNVRQTLLLDRRLQGVYP